MGYRDEVNDDLSAVARVRTPCGMLVLDVLIYDEMFGKVNPIVSVFNDAVGGDLPTTTRPNDRLPVREFVRHLGRSVDCLHTPDVSRYAEMVDSALERLGWDHTKFDVYRCRVEFLLVPSSVVMKFNLPDKDDYVRGQR